MTQKFNKKIYSLKLLLNDIAFIVGNILQITKAMKNKKINKAFVEKIMLVVTAVNGCTYCAWFHAKKAVSAGINKDEVKNMLKLQFKANATKFEMLALLYAQHYAETNRKPEKEMTEKLTEFYGKKNSKHIFLIIRMIYFGNLTGNTFDAFLSRLKGKKAKNSNIIFEFIFFIIIAPFFLPLIPYTKKYR